MKTLINTMMFAGALMASATFTNKASAQDCHPKTTVERNGSVVRQDMVKADLNTPAEERDTVKFIRTINTAENGYYSVIITDENGGPRMTGTYLDSKAQQADGLFTYYYPNGQIESKGMYANGVKTGTWERFNDDGTAKAERNYTGLTWEETAASIGAE